MIIRLYEEKDVRSLVIELYDKVAIFSVEIQKDLFYHYDENLNLTRIEVRDTKLIDPILKELEELLKSSEIKIIKKAA
ncbi:MAG: hypothetical protein HYS08_00755 [Chlamydiae bacterium]|nr:hypothetical protein [Chlamydiota bacterium]MBI3265901.1 hypothetical protein [Chlamydiota bacterium]